MCQRTVVDYRTKRNVMWTKDNNRESPAYTLEDMHRGIAESIAKAKAARIHPVLIERALKSAADSFAQIRAMTEAVI
jgi:hypothetical protein